MKFVPGKFYKTRSGSKAYFIGFTNFSLDYSCVFEVFGKGVNNYSSEGKYLLNEDRHDLDIISEWEDKPKKIEKHSVPLEYVSDKYCIEHISSKLNELIEVLNNLREKQ